MRMELVYYVPMNISYCNWVLNVLFSTEAMATGISEMHSPAFLLSQL